MANFLVPDSKTRDGAEYRMALWNSILDEQFDLSYYIPGMSWRDTENMAVFERKEMYSRLLQRKTQEKEAIEKARGGNNSSS